MFQRQTLVQIILVSLMVWAPVEAYPAGPRCSELLRQKEESSASLDRSIPELFQSPEVRALLSAGASMQVLGDYLLERGHSYGQFLSLWNARRVALQAGESEKALRLEEKIVYLLRAKMVSWLPTGVRGPVRALIFHDDGRIRGLVVRLDAELPKFLKNGGLEFMQAMKMDTVQIEGALDRALPSLAQTFKSLQGIPTLRRVLLNQVWFRSADDWGELSKLTELEELGLDHPTFGTNEAPIAAVVPVIAQLKQLKSLSLGGIPIAYLELLGPLDKLTELAIADCDLDQDDFLALGRLKPLRKLIFNRVTRSWDHSRRQGGNLDLPHLTYLAVRESEFSRLDLYRFFTSKVLTHLDLDGAHGVRPSEWSGMLGKMVALPNLTHLGLNNNQLRVSQLKPLGLLKSLTHLSLTVEPEGVGLRDELNQDFRRIRNRLPNLRELDLRMSHGDFGIDSIDPDGARSESWTVGSLPQFAKKWAGEYRLPAKGRAINSPYGHTHGDRIEPVYGHTHSLPID